VIESFAVNWIAENYKWLFDGLGAVAVVALIGWIWRLLAPHSKAVTDRAPHVIRTPSKNMGRISFDYLPASPLDNGWRLALKDKPLRQASASADRPGGITIKIDDAIDINVEKYQRLCNRVLFAAKLSDRSYAYAKVRLVSTDGQMTVKDAWIACDTGDKPPRKVSPNEWVVYRKPGGDGWASFDLSLPNEVSQTLGQTGDLRFSELLGFRLRGTMSISPIDLYRDDPPDMSTDQIVGTRSSRRVPWSRSDKIGAWSVAVTLLAIIVGLAIPEVRRFLGLERPVTVQNPPLSAVPAPATAEPAKLLVAQVAKDIRELRQQNHVFRLADSESDKDFAEIPVNSYGFVGSPELVYRSSSDKYSVDANADALDFEIQKLADGSGLLLGYVGPETFELLREGMRAKSNFTLYSGAWKDAPNLVAIPISGLKYSRSRILRVEGGQRKPIRVAALDCAVH
jgi:hypothetical protein